MRGSACEGFLLLEGNSIPAAKPKRMRQSALPPKQIAIINQKGGSGKTTTTVNLAAALAEAGQRVLVIDLDAQASATQWLGVQQEHPGIYEVLTQGRNLADVIQPTAFEGIDLVPASAALAQVERALAGEVGGEVILREALDALPQARWNYVLMDCPPSLGIVSVSALAACEQVLVPVEAHVMALSGLAALVGTVDRVRTRLNPQAHIAAILACRVDLRKNLCQDVLASLRERFGDQVLTSLVRENVRLAEAPSFALPITKYDPKSGGAKDYRAVAAELHGRLSRGAKAKPATASKAAPKTKASAPPASSPTRSGKASKTGKALKAATPSKPTKTKGA